MRFTSEEQIIKALNSIAETLKEIEVLLRPDITGHDCHASPEDGCACGRREV